MTLKTYGETLEIINQNYYIELCNFINCQNTIHGGAVLCENIESDLFITLSLFYKCKVFNGEPNISCYGGCVYYSSPKCSFTDKCCQLIYSSSDYAASTIYSNAKDFQCYDTSMDICEGNRSNLMMKFIHITFIKYIKYHSFLSSCWFHNKMQRKS